MMKKLLLVMMLGMSLGGCATVDKFISGIPNPLTSPTLASIESVYGSAATLAVQYKSACAKGVIAGSCKATVARLQKADNYAYAEILVVRKAAKDSTVNLGTALLVSNDAVNAFYTAARNP